MITVGLDFGTHQTKVCIEKKVSVAPSYSFMRFDDENGNELFTLPSVVGVSDDDFLSYGYLPRNFKGDIIRYFKQNAFRTSTSGLSQTNAMFFSTWYLANILFDLEDIYGQEFTIQMGAPTDSSHISQVKEIATRIIASAYRLVEDVFEKDKQKFLATPLDELARLTVLVPYSKQIKEEYGLLVFPEAYACLKPLVSQGKLAKGMSLMIDIGGGTTDISFFAIKDNLPQVYDFYSINKGLNYLACVDNNSQEGTMAKVRDESAINPVKKIEYINEVKRVCKQLRDKLKSEFKSQTHLNIQRLWDALENRPLVYCGGGSTFDMLCVQYGGFKDTKRVSFKEWNTRAVKDIAEIYQNDLFPILSTAYGLAISTENDNITMKPFRDIFESIRGYKEEVKRPQHSLLTSRSSIILGGDYGGFSYTDDFDAWK